MRTSVVRQRPVRLRPYIALDIAKSLWASRWLAWEMAKRELSATTKGTVLGLGWLVVRPAIQTVAYVVVVALIFRVRLSPSASPFTYALYVLCAMAPWQLTTQVLQDSPSLIRTRIDILKQVIYPLEILPITSIVIASIGPLILLSIYLLLGAISGELHWTLILLPIPIALLMIMLLGSAWVLMVVGLVFVDLREVIAAVLGLIVYMSPVVLSQSMVSQRIWRAIELNPLSHVIICFRDVFEGQFHLLSWGLFVAMAAASLVLGVVGLTGAKRIFSEYG